MGRNTNTTIYQEMTTIPIAYPTPSVSGGVTSVNSADANATVANPTSTPVLTIVSAPKLQTAHTINGTSFNGTADITVTVPVSTGVTGLGTSVATQLANAADGTNASGVGFRGIPQDLQSNTYTTVMADAGKHILQTGATKTITIDSNANVAYPIGTAITFIATNATGCSIAITADTMTLANSTSTGTRTLAQNGIATAIKLTSTTWLISGTGLT